MPRVRMVRGVVGEDYTDWLPGTEHEASDRFAAYLIRRGKAAPVGDPVPLPDTPLVTQPALVRDPRPSRRR